MPSRAALTVISKECPVLFVVLCVVGGVSPALSPLPSLALGGRFPLLAPLWVLGALGFGFFLPCFLVAGRSMGDPRRALDGFVMSHALKGIL